MNQYIELLNVVLWPSVCLVVALIFRKQITGIVGRVTHLEVTGFKADLERVESKQNARIQAQYWFLQGQISELRDSLEEAESFYRLSTERDDRYTIAFTNLAVVLRRIAEQKSSSNLKVRILKQAIDSCDRAEKAEETYPKKDRELGGIYLLRAGLWAELIRLPERPEDDTIESKVKRDLELALEENVELVKEIDEDPALAELQTLSWVCELKESCGGQSRG